MDLTSHNSHIDTRSARMLDIYARRRFHGLRERQRPRQTLLIWWLYTKLWRSLKLLLDVVIAAAALLLVTPIMVFTALAIKLDSHGPILFRQPRVGRNGETFSL